MAPVDRLATAFSRRAARKGEKEEAVRLQLQAALYNAFAEHLRNGPSRT